MALVAYRNLLRSARIAFQGDASVLSAARIEVRKNFESNRHLQTGSEEIQKSLAHANEVAKFLRENVVQGEATEGDNYSTGQYFDKLGQECMLIEAEIRIHEHTERGDNEDIKKSKGKSTLGGTKCCSA
ncbi:Mitochondrial zinc maintenance protein 1, mitochondrial [Didymella pomorum]